MAHATYYPVDPSESNHARPDEGSQIEFCSPKLLKNREAKLPVVVLVYLSGLLPEIVGTGYNRGLS